MFYSVQGSGDIDLERWLLDGLARRFEAIGYRRAVTDAEDVRLVFNFVRPDEPRPYRRKAQATFVVTVAVANEPPQHVLRAGYPLLVRSLANLLLYLVPNGPAFDTYFVTLEQGFYPVPYQPGQDDLYFDRLFERIQPLATSNLIINNEFHPDLPETLWRGDEVTERVRWAARKIDEMNLWPAPFPIQDILPPEDLRHVKRLYGIGGLSYGNLSARKDPDRFWMSASGVNKATLKTVGEDILLVSGFLPERKAMRLSVPPNVRPRRVSVDAIEHWMIYQEHPQVGAIVHIHAWMDGVKSTQVNYPCGTVELAKAVAELVRQADNPARAIIGLKNHGLTITGPDLDDIFERIDGKIIPQVPMT